MTAREVTPEQRIASSAGAHKSWAQTKDRTARTAPARAALEAKFLAAADGDPIRAAHYKTAYYKDLAERCNAAKRARREAERPPPKLWEGDNA